MNTSNFELKYKAKYKLLAVNEDACVLKRIYEHCSA